MTERESTQDLKPGKPHAQLLVFGGGPGGYTAAFRAADLGLDVIMVEQRDRLGGVCLNVGCIPSKALLHAAHVIHESREIGKKGIEFQTPDIDLGRLRTSIRDTVDRMAAGLAGLAAKRRVRLIQGEGRFTGPNELEVRGVKGVHRLGFDQAIIAVGSRPRNLPFLPADPRIMDSTGALALEDIPARLLVVGGGIVGLEMATIYSALGAKVTVVEQTDSVLPGCDVDLSQPLCKRLANHCESIMVATTIKQLQPRREGLRVSFEGDRVPPQTYDRVLVAAGRLANGQLINAGAAGVTVEESGIVRVDSQQRTNVRHIFAIGDVAGGPMLAHKAIREGKVAAEAAAGFRTIFDTRLIPNVVYTDPEVAWVGLTETEAGRDGTKYERYVFPWWASGRAATLGRDEGLTKILVDPATRHVVGVGITGTNAGELIAEATLAMETGCEPGDLGLTVHPHPTLSETLALAAEASLGTLTDF